MAYAVIRTGGKQYRVAEGQSLRIEKIDGEAGSEVQFKDVVMANGEAGVVVDPAKLGSMKVTAKIVRQGRGRKVHTLRYTRRKGFQKRIGHRQSFTEIRIQSIA